MIGRERDREFDFRWYEDRRRGGEPRWSVGPPRDALMRVPDDLVACPIFIGGRDSSGRRHYRGTAFMVWMPPVDEREFGAPCLVTARHNVRKAMETYGNVWVRLNTPGGSEEVEIGEGWTTPD